MINHGNKSAENKLAAYLIRSWRTSYEGQILEFWCRYSQEAQNEYCNIAAILSK
jgi:hypothetical protein